MSTDLLELSKIKRCVFYNDLSHMNPIYAASGGEGRTYAESEEIYHKKNIYLLAIQFDHVIIGIDNILGFTKFSQKEIISKVVLSEWFMKLTEAGVIKISGWGTSINSDMVKNQVEYSSRYKSFLKEASYINYIKSVSSNIDMVVREREGGDRDHYKFFLRRMRSSADFFGDSEFCRIIDWTIKTQDNFGHVGTMEIYPISDQMLSGNHQKETEFYRAYYNSWQDYSSQYYFPAITVDTARARAPSRINRIGHNSVLSSVYSPDFFGFFLKRRLGNNSIHKILNMDVEALIKLRNGDWAIFIEEYHRSISHASKILWVIEEAMLPGFLSNEELMEKIVSSVLSDMTIHDFDVENYAAVIDSIFAIAMIKTPFGPFVRVLKSRINKAIHIFRSIMSRQKQSTESFFRKFERAMNKTYFIG